jgi:zinc finger CCCH domain-containing protein 13
MQMQNLGMGWNMQNGQANPQAFGNGLGFNNAQAGFGMDWNAGNMMNPMMQMQMQNAGWGGYPNMMGTGVYRSCSPYGPSSNSAAGASAMGMNPMDFSQGMFGGYGMQGMNGMNPNMAGMNGMNVGMDYSSGYGNWGAQQQQMNGGYGANAGYYSQGANFQSHQGNYSSVNQQPHQYAKHNYHNQRFNGQAPTAPRGYGRGQGYYGQAPQGSQGFRNTSQPNSRHSSQGAFSQVSPTTQRPNVDGSRDDGASRQRTVSDATARRPSNAQSEVVREVDKDIGKDEVVTKNNDAEAPSKTDDQIEEDAPKDVMHADDTTNQEAAVDVTPLENDARVEPGQTESIPIATHESTHTDYPTNFDSNPIPSQNYDMPYNQQMDYYQQHHPGEYATRGRGMRGGYRGAFRGRGGYPYLNSYTSQNYHGLHTDAQNLTPAEPKGVGVEGAPTGPKAWREGLPNTTLRGRGGFLAMGRGAGYQPRAQSHEQPDQTAASKPRDE